jgi:hypothetical protein
MFRNNAGTGSNTLALDESGPVAAGGGDGSGWRVRLLQHAAHRMVAAGNGGRLIAVTSVHEHQLRV